MAKNILPNIHTILGLVKVIEGFKNATLYPEDALLSSRSKGNPLSFKRCTHLWGYTFMGTILRKSILAIRYPYKAKCFSSKLVFHRLKKIILKAQCICLQIFNAKLLNYIPL